MAGRWEPNLERQAAKQAARVAAQQADHQRKAAWISLCQVAAPAQHASSGSSDAESAVRSLACTARWLCKQEIKVGGKDVEEEREAAGWFTNRLLFKIVKEQHVYACQADSLQWHPRSVQIFPKHVSWDPVKVVCVWSQLPIQPKIRRRKSKHVNSALSKKLNRQRSPRKRKYPQRISKDDV